MKLMSSLCLVLCAAPILAFSATIDFTRALYVGMRGEDVRALQKFLNTDAETHVAESGDGSLGNETDYFGYATKRALIKFQEKYRAEILAPVGLTFGTGIFGLKTRDKANALLKTTHSEITAKIKETPTISVAKGEVILMFPSQYSGKPGTMITLSGAGFTANDNIIYFGNEYAVVKASSWNGQSITFKVPSIPKGIYSLFVKNARGDSNKDAFFVVTDGVTPEPKIESVSPEHVRRGEDVSIKGSGFVSRGNMVRSSVSVIENISSADGMSISFTIPGTLFKETPVLEPGRFSLPVWLYVINENGVSNEKKFILDF